MKKEFNVFLGILLIKRKISICSQIALARVAITLLIIDIDHRSPDKFFTIYARESITYTFTHYCKSNRHDRTFYVFSVVSTASHWAKRSPSFLSLSAWYTNLLPPTRWLCCTLIFCRKHRRDTCLYDENRINIQTVAPNNFQNARKKRTFSTHKIIIQAIYNKNACVMLPHLKQEKYVHIFNARNTIPISHRF